MKRSKWIFALAGSLWIGAAGSVFAEATPSEAGLRSELTALKARLAELEAHQNDAWLNERRTEEVKSLIQEVLADADTRASMMAAGSTAGYDKGHFFIASEDGSFLMKIGGQAQFRYVYNSRDDDGGVTATDVDEAGFQFRRVKLFFKGHVGSPKITYSVGIQTNRNTENIDLDHAYFGYQVMDGVTLFGGEAKAPFLREETTSSSRQLTVERSLVNELFTAGRVQGVWAVIDVDDNMKFALAFTDGANSGEVGAPITGKDFHNDATDFAVTARLDLRLAGEWAQMKDFSAWAGEQQAVFFGAAVHHEIGESGGGAIPTLGAGTPFNATGGAVGYDEFTAWTVDGSIESDGGNLYAAVMGIHFNNNGGTNDIDAYGLVVQGGVMLIPNKFEPFVRWEYVDPDTSHEVNLITVGTNYYIRKHNAKFTTDVVWALNSLANVGGSSGLGLLTDIAGKKDQVALRAQFQLLF